MKIHLNAIICTNYVLIGRGALMYALTAKAMRYMDEYTISKGIPSAVLMENAAGDLLMRLFHAFLTKPPKCS